MGRVFSRDIKSKVEDREIRRVMGTGMDTMDIFHGKPLKSEDLF